MQLKINSSDSTGCRKTMRRMLSPLCGFDTQITFALRDWLDPHFIVAGAELAGVHVLLQQPQAPSGGYHIGGGGIFLEEALWRSLGESVERYAQLLAGISRRQNIVMATYSELANGKTRMIPADRFKFFSQQQHERPDFPFHPFSVDSVMGWVKAPSLLDDAELWVPAQLVFVGYTVRQEAGEPWLLSAVTTGSAAHTQAALALRTALLELIELDSVVGHWYSSAVAAEILFDERTRAIERLIERQFPRHAPRPKFYWLPNADLPGLTVACQIRQRPGIVPALSIGLGCGLSLVEAMYKALLEAVGVERLGASLLINEALVDDASDPIDPGQIFDLDQNVAFYASWENCAIVDAKFSSDRVLAASNLPADNTQGTEEQIRYLVDGFRQTGKELIILDLTTADIRILGFTALRVWSPDTLGMCLPSCPPRAHPRFQAYGGSCHDAPHPYP